MFEKVNPSHPDKIADRIAGAIVDLAYTKQVNPKVAAEVLIGHGKCYVIIETSVKFKTKEIKNIIKRIANCNKSEIIIVPQDKHLSDNQLQKIKCGDNGIFKGEPLTEEEKELTTIAKKIYDTYKSDGKYIIDNDSLIICQSNANSEEIADHFLFKDTFVNPLGEWTGGINVDSGATNRKLGSDMGRSVTGGGLHGKDLSKADVSINIYAWLEAQKNNSTIEIKCAIGDEYINGKPYSEIVDIAKEYINTIGGFEKFAEWGLIR